MFNIVCGLVEAEAGGSWTHIVLVISTDGAAATVGHISGDITFLEAIMSPGVYRIWCGSHQLNLSIQSTFDDSLKTSFHYVLHPYISYLRRQTTFKSAIGSVCPKESSTR